MKKKFKKTAFILIAFQLIISCNNKKETEFVKTLLSNNYKIDLPSRFEKTDEGMWEFPEHTYLSIDVVKGTVKDIQKEVETEAKVREIQENYKGKVFIKTESFEKDGFKGVISFYEKDNKGKGLGLVNLKSYIVFAVVQDKNNRIYINSLSLNRNLNEDLTKSIKSISLNDKEIVENKFDFEKTKKDGYQIFSEDNFIIKCKGKLLLDKLRIEQMKQNGLSDNSKPFHVFFEGVDYNINVGDYSSILNNQNDEEIQKYNDEDLSYYQTKFDEMGIKNNKAKFKDFDAIYYQNSQEGKLTNAVYFHHKMKSYMLQVTSGKNSEKLFNDFINTFELIEK